MKNRNEAMTLKIMRDAIKDVRHWQFISKVVAITGFGMVVVGVVMAMMGILKVGLIMGIGGVITRIIKPIFFARVEAAERRVDALHKRLSNNVDKQ